MRTSLHRAVVGTCLFVLGVLACSSRDTPEEKAGKTQERLTQTELARILSFEGTLGTSGDWVKSGGTVVSSTLRASAGTHSMVLSGTPSISVTSTALSALGSVGTKMTLDLWLPSALVGQPNKGNLQAFFDSPALQLYSYATSNVALAALTPGQFSRVEIPLDSSLRSKLSQSGYSDLKIKFTFNLANTTQTFVDNLVFSSAGTGAGGGTSTGGASAIGGTRAAGGAGGLVNSGGAPGNGGAGATGATANTGSSPSLGGSNNNAGGNAPSNGGAPTNGGAMGIGGAVLYTGGVPALGGASTITNAASGGALAGGGAASGGTSTTALGGATSGSSTSTGSTASTGSTTSTGGTGTAGGSAYTFSFQLPAGVNRSEVVFATTGGDLWIDDGVNAVNGAGYASVSAVGGGKVNRIGVAAQVQNVWSGGDVQLANNAVVHGALLTSGALSTQAGAEVLGATTQQANLGPLQTISWVVNFPNNTLPAVSLTHVQALSPSGYPDYAVKTGAQLSLTAGTYFFESLILEPGSTLQIDNTAGPVFIYLKNGFIQRGNIVAISPRANVLFGLAGTSPVSIASSLNGIFVAPAASVSLETLTGSTHVGSVFAKSITVHQNTATTQRSLKPANFCGPSDACSSFCACPAGSYPCNGDSTHCDTGLVCALDGDRCTCPTNCASKHCGDDPSDGCGGICPNLCANGEAGCTTDLHCPAGSRCFIGGGPRKGFAAGTNVCLPTICEEQDPKKPGCGVNGADCGPCPACIPDCTGKTCGDDGCGGSCGTVGANQACVAGNTVASNDPSIEHSPAFPAAKPIAASEAVTPGAIPADFKVTARGTPEYSIPIEVPPGREGVEPKLKIVHTGDMGNGILGQGWALRGLSRVERCRKTIAQDGIAKQIDLKSSDAFCIDGQRLVEDHGVANAPAHKYHTEIESFQLVQPFGTETDGAGKYVGPKGFKVWTKSGLIMTYGSADIYGHAMGPSQSTQLNDSVVVTQGVNRIWNLSKVEDHAGNYMAISYSQFQGEGGTTEIVPKLIVYGGQANPSEVSNGTFLDYDSSIEFKYEQRPDARHHYVLGQWDYSTLRLKTIQTFNKGQPVRSYEIEYSAVGVEEQKVSAVKACAVASDGSTACMKPSIFYYNDAGGGVFENTVANPRPVLVVFDADGDGTDDLQTHSELIRKGNRGVEGEPGTFERIGLTKLGAEEDLGMGSPFYEHPALNQVQALDRDGDGTEELVLVKHQLEPNGVASHQLLFLHFDGTTYQRTTYPTSCTEGGFVGDFDGDGRKDYLCTDGYRAYIRRIRGPLHGEPDTTWFVDDEIELANVPGGMIYSANHVFIFDIDGDGTDDIAYLGYARMATALVNTSGGKITDPGNLEWAPIGIELTSRPNDQQCTPLADNCTFPTQDDQQYAGAGYNGHAWVQVLDVNGDGLKDIYYDSESLVLKDTPTVYTWNPPLLFLNTGKGFRASSVAIPEGGIHFPAPTFFSNAYFVYDYDRDGRDDLVDPARGYMLRGTQRGTLEWAIIREKDDQESRNTAADLDGDGTEDWINAYSGVRWGNPTSNGQLRLIGDGLGKYIHITYDLPESTSVTPVYVTQPGANRPADTANLHRVAPLVSKYTEYQLPVGATGADDTIWNGTHVFQYFGANVGLGGRGWYGFGHVQERVLEYPAGNVFRTIDTYYHNTDFWNAGRVREVHDLSGRAVASAWHSGYRRELVTTNTWSQHVTSVGSEQFTALMSKDVTLWEGDVALWDAFTRYMYLDGIGNVTSESTETTIAGAQSPPDLRTHEYSYAADLSNWLVTNPLRVSDSSAVNGVEETHNTAYTYYPNGLVHTVIREPGGAEFELTTTYARDPVSSLVTRIDSTDASGNTRSARIDYDSEKRYPTHYVREKAEEGLALDTEVAFDPRTGQVQTSMDPNGVVTQWQYDGFGRIRSIYTPTEVTSMTYWSGASYLASTIGEGAMSTFTVVTGTGESRLTVTNIDSMGRVRAKIQSGVKDSYLFQEFTRDWAGRVTKATVPHLSGDTSQGAYSYTYDGLGRVATVTAPDQRVTDYDYVSHASSPSSQDALFADPNDFAVEARLRTEPNGLLEAMVFNHRGQPVRVAQSPVDANVSASDIVSGTAGTTNHFKYGVFGRLSATTDPDGETTAITYDRIGRRLSIGNDTIGTTAFSYNAFDEVTSELQADGTRRCYEHDSLGRVVELTQAGADGSCSTLGSLIANWTYDGASDNELGKLVSTFRASTPGSTSGTTMRYHYEPKPTGSAPNIGRLQAVEQELPDLQAPLVTTAEYSGPWLSKLHYPRESGAEFAVVFTRDSIGTVTRVARDGATDATPYWELTRVDQGQRIAEEHFGSGTVTSYDYFAPGSSQGECNHPNGGSCMPGALQALSTVLPTGTPATDLQYYYDNSGNLANIYFDPQTSERYSYDVYGRLIAQAQMDGGGRGKTTYWSYTPAGDITEVETGDPRSANAPVLHSYAYDATRRHLLLGMSGAAGNAQTVTPDVKGNIIGRSGWNIPNGAQALEYNESNLPTAIRGGTGGDTLFEYNADLQRVAKRGPVETTLYMDDLFECVGNSTPPGSTFGCNEQRFKIFAGSRQVAVVSRDLFGNDKTNYIHTDHLGSDTVITDANGNVTERRKYDAFGQITTDSDMTASPVTAGYTGHEHDAELGLINMKGRIYDPFTRRFLTPDPFVMEPLNPQGLNRFAYVRNNPLNLVDPTGFEDMGGGGCYNGCGPDSGSISMGGASSSGGSGSQTSASSTSQGGSGTFTSDGFSASGYETVDLGSGSGPRPGDTSYGGGGPGDMSGRIDPSPHGGGPGADYQAPGMQSPMSAPQGINMSGQSWSPSNNGSPSSSGGSQSSQPVPTPGAGSPGRTNGNVNGSGATGAPLPYTPNSPAWLQEAASLAVTMSLTPAAKLVLESFASREGWQAFLPQGAKIVQAAKQKYGGDGILAMARKGDIKQIDTIVREVGLSKGQRELLHAEMQAIKGENGLGSIEELLELAREIKNSFPGK